MLAGCIFTLAALGMTYTSDEPKDLLVFKCKSEHRFMVDKKEVFVYDKLADGEIYIYGEKR